MASRQPVSAGIANGQTGLPESAVEIDELGLAVLHGLRPGDWCPYCGEEKIDYDSTLNLACPRCGQVEGGCFS